MAPVHDAFSVPEILEEIILNLPLRQIVKMRSLCRESCRIIDETTSIQRALFMQPTATETLEWSIPRGRPFLGTTTRLPSKAAWKGDATGHSRTRVPILNPFFPIAQHEDRGLHEKQWFVAKYPGVFLDTTVLGTEDWGSWQHHPLCVQLPDTLFHPNQLSGLFKRMLLTRPPIKNLHYHLPYGHAVSVRSPGGRITTGDIFDGSSITRNDCKQSSSRADDLCGKHRIALLSKTADEITGYGMLAILDSDFENIDSELFLKNKTTGETSFCVN